MCKQLVKSTHPGLINKVLILDQVGLLSWVRNDNASIQCGPMRKRHWPFGSRKETGSGCNSIQCSRFHYLRADYPFLANKLDSGHPLERSTKKGQMHVQIDKLSAFRGQMLSYSHMDVKDHHWHPQESHRSPYHKPPIAPCRC